MQTGTEQNAKTLLEMESAGEITAYLDSIDPSRAYSELLLAGEDGNTVLHLRADANDAKSIEAIMTFADKHKFANFVFDALKKKNIQGETALHLAAEQEKALAAILASLFAVDGSEALKVLGIANRAGRSPLHLIVIAEKQSVLLESAKSSGKLSAALLLGDEKQGRSLLHFSIYEKENNKGAISQISEYSKDLNTNDKLDVLLKADKFGNTPLHWLMDVDSYDDDSFAKILSIVGRDMRALLSVLRAKNNEEETAIDTAFLNKNEKAIEALYMGILSHRELLPVLAEKNARGVSLLAQMLKFEFTMLGRLVEHSKTAITFLALFNMEVDGKKISALVRDANPSTELLKFINGITAPVGKNVSLPAQEDVPFAELISEIFSDIDTMQLNVRADTQPTFGTFEVNATHIIYTSHLDTFGTDSFSLIANDGYQDSNQAVVTMEIAPVNDLPELRKNNTFNFAKGVKGATEIIDLNDLVFDVEGELSFEVNFMPNDPCSSNGPSTLSCKRDTAYRQEIRFTAIDGGQRFDHVAFIDVQSGCTSSTPEALVHNVRWFMEHKVHLAKCVAIRDKLQTLGSDMQAQVKSACIVTGQDPALRAGYGPASTRAFSKFSLGGRDLKDVDQVGPAIDTFDSKMKLGIKWECSGIITEDLSAECVYEVVTGFCTQSSYNTDDCAAIRTLITGSHDFDCGNIA